MKFIEEIIIAFDDGEMTEVEFWRRGTHDKSWGYKTYKATPWAMGRVFSALKTEYQCSKCDFRGPEGNMTLHIEV